MARRVISISEENYQALRKLGLAGDSMNDAIDTLLRMKGLKASADLDLD